MASEPVIVLQGPRSVGKSTLLRALASSSRTDIIDLDDLATRDAVRTDPALFAGSKRPVYIDEFQHVPEVLDAIKAELNQDSSPGRFVITGSTRYATQPATAQALTGRAHIIDVWPLSQGEIGGAQETFAETFMTDPGSLVGPEGKTTRADYIRRVVTGGFPMALRRNQGPDQARWFDDYIELVLSRDVLELSKIRQRRLLPLLLQQLAGQTGGVLNIASAGAEIQMERSTAENYTKLLEAVFLVHRLPAWGTTLGSRVGAAPKVHVVDSGLASRLLRVTENKLAAASAQALTEFGHLLETFAVNEIIKQADWLDDPVAIGHWRTRDDEEVDLVIEGSDGRVVAIEVKAGSRVPGDSMRGLLQLRRRLGSAFLAGIVLYTGQRSYTQESNIHVLPLDLLWRSREAPDQASQLEDVS